jgi:hypothetical protein
MNQLLHDRLAEVAARQETTNYAALELLLELDMRNPDDRRKIGELLGEVSRYEREHGRPLLSSVVWHKDGSTPGHGFYKLGLELGMVGAGEDELAFAIRQLRETWAARSSPQRVAASSNYRET